MRQLLLLLPLLLGTSTVLGQTPFTVVWRTVAQVRSNPPLTKPMVQPLGANPSTGTPGVAVNRIVITPTVVSGAIGQLTCLSELDIAAFTAAGQRAAGVPLTVDLRQDHLRNLSFSSRKNDLCFKPARAGEYIVRFSSKLPAADGTFRGAQVFVRVAEKADGG